MIIPKEIIDKIDYRISLYPSGKDKSVIMYALDILQRHNEGFINKSIMDFIATKLNISKVSVEEVVSFYSHYKTEKPGKNCIKVCNGISCFLRGSSQILDNLQEKLNIKVGQTNKDKKFTLEEVECIAACTNAPAIIINDKYHNNLNKENINSVLSEYENHE
jgi:NADH-quinone oxidoreductase E subunit